MLGVASRCFHRRPKVGNVFFHGSLPLDCQSLLGRVDDPAFPQGRFRFVVVRQLLGRVLVGTPALAPSPAGRRGRNTESCSTAIRKRSCRPLRSTGHVGRCPSWRSPTWRTACRDRSQSRPPRGSAAGPAACKSSPRCHLPFETTSVALDARKPIRRFSASVGGTINCRMASKTTLNWASYFCSSSSSFRASSLWVARISRRRTNARMMAMLTSTARSLRSTLDKHCHALFRQGVREIPSPATARF